MTRLPIDSLLPSVISALEGPGSLVLVAPPGSGKTTRVAPAILRSGLLAPAQPALILLQPRRVAARASAARIASENGWALGEEVGYQVRFDRAAGPRTRLLVATEGILTRRLLADPFLEGVGGVILDEFHERSLHTDLALALLREVKAVRDDLLVVVMSATLDAAPIARFLGDCPVLRGEGRAYPVAIEHLPQGPEPLPTRVALAVATALAAPDAGDILVFLPGADEIRRSARELASLAARENLLILPLHGSLSAEEQDRALRPADRRKVRPGHEPGGNLLDDRRRRHGDRLGPRPRGGARPGAGARPPGAGQDQQGVGRPARGQGRAHRAGPLPAALVGTRGARHGRLPDVRSRARRPLRDGPGPARLGAPRPLAVPLVRGPAARVPGRRRAVAGDARRRRIGGGADRGDRAGNCWPCPSTRDWGACCSGPPPKGSRTKARRWPRCSPRRTSCSRPGCPRGRRPSPARRTS